MFLPPIDYTNPNPCPTLSAPKQQPSPDATLSAQQNVDVFHQSKPQQEVKGSTATLLLLSMSKPDFILLMSSFAREAIEWSPILRRR